VYRNEQVQNRVLWRPFVNMVTSHIRESSYANKSLASIEDGEFLNQSSEYQLPRRNLFQEVGNITAYYNSNTHTHTQEYISENGLYRNFVDVT
jgi:hypothetical protein